MNTTDFDPEAPLPGPPDPWASTDQPSTRTGPPFHMTEMIEAEPFIAERILAQQAEADGGAARVARAIRRAVAAGDPIIVTGCGTSEHAALGVTAILREAIRRGGLSGPGGRPVHEPVSEQAFELSLDPPSAGLVIAISHEGGTTATNAAIAASRDAGARTAIITVSDRSPGAELADLVVQTSELDQSWCHTVGYTSPLVAAVAIGGHIASQPPDAMRTAVRELMVAGVGRTAAAESAAASLAGTSPILVIASGADRPAGRELTLKIEEGTWIPAAYRDLETFLHGHLAAVHGSAGLVLILTDRDRRAERLARAAGTLRAARAIGIEVAAILAADAAAELPTELTPAGRIVIPEAPTLPSPVAALLGSAIPLQLLTERLARARGVDPDPIHRDVDRYRVAAEAAEEG